MSPSRGTRALGSSIIDASCLVLESAWPEVPLAGSLLYRPGGARQSPGCRAFCGVSRLANGSRRGKHRLRSLKTPCFAQLAAANWSLRGQLFSLFINSTRGVWGLLPGVGSLAFVWLGKG